ncbi:MAG: caspase family protein [Bacteroidales bacterium]|nr:caspase family protein [Bacteroidales bacterium]
MKRVFSLLIVAACIISMSAQTFHTIIMVNKEEPNRQVDRTADFDNMKAFFTNCAKALGYKNSMVTYSGDQFRSTNAISAIDGLNVSDGDIVVFYYSGHGANWDDDEWPHMAYLDRQVGQTSLYNRLKEKYSNAKLILCISDCCNMDSEGQRREKKSYASFDPDLTKKLFTDFDGSRGFQISASIRGQYSWSNLKYGALFGIALREAVNRATNGTINPTWQYVLEDAKTTTLSLTEQKQMPQYRMDRW